MFNTLEDILEHVCGDNRISLADYMQVRDFADKKFQVLIDRFGKHNDLSAFQESADVTMHLLQRSVLMLKKEKLSDEEKSIIKEALESQIKYLQIGWELVNTLF